MHFFLPLSLALGLAAADCKFSLSIQRTQNPVAGGNTTLNCAATVTYGDGSSEIVQQECSEVSSTHCYDTMLPNAFCFKTNSDISDGYIDYGAQHSDFNSDLCNKDNSSGGWGDSRLTECSFAC